jgi:AcrR family transcriptional regulator
VRLVEAAREVFAQRGFAATRIADIVERAGMSQGAFYRHFPDRDAVFLAAVHDPIEAIFAATARTEEDSSSDEAAIVARHTRFFRAYAEHRGLLRTWREGAAVRDSGFDAVWAHTRGRFIARVEAWLHALHEAGEIERTDFELLAEGLGAVLEQLAFVRIALAPRDPTGPELEALGRAAGAIWARALPRTGPGTA